VRDLSAPLKLFQRSVGLFGIDQNQSADHDRRKNPPVDQVSDVHRAKGIRRGVLRDTNAFFHYGKSCLWYVYISQKVRCNYFLLICQVKVMYKTTEAIDAMKKNTEGIEPLRILRQQAGDDSGAITQVELSQATDISLDTVRAIENRRRDLTRSLLQRIKHTIGAQWGPEEGTWHLLDAPELPYTAEIYRKFRTNWLESFHATDRETHLLCRRLIELMQRVDPKKYNQLFYRLSDFLDELREELSIGGADALFDDTQFAVKISRRDDTNEIVTIQRVFRLGPDALKVDKTKSSTLLDLQPWALERRAQQLGLRYKPASGRRIAKKAVGEKSDA